MNEEIKKELNQGIEGLKGQLDNLIEEKSQKMGEASSEERKKLKDEFDGQFNTLNDSIKKMQEQYDELSVKANRFNERDRKNVKTLMKEAFEKSNQFAKWKEGSTDKATVDMPDGLFTKLDDMTQANSFESTTVAPVDTRPGIYYDPDRMWHVRDLLPVGTTNSNSVRVVREYAYTDNTAVTSEGSEYKQGDFDLKATDATVYKITNYVIASEELMEDVAGLTSYIYTRLPSKLKLEEDDQLLYGSGSSEISGLSTNATSYSDNLSDSNVQFIDVLADAVRQIRDDEYMASAILLHPADVTSRLLLEKDDNNNYMAPWVFTGANPTIAGVPVIQSTSITQGTFFVGDFARAAQIFDRRQAAVEIANTNEDNFIKGMVTIRASERIALAIYRPTAFLYGSIATALAEGSG